MSSQNKKRKNLLKKIGSYIPISCQLIQFDYFWSSQNETMKYLIFSNMQV